MKAQDFFTQSAFEAAKLKLDSREEFELEGKRGGNKILFMGDIIDTELAKDIWDGIAYLLHIDESTNTGGHGYATTDYSCFDNWQTFLKKVDEMLSRYPGYVKQDDCNVQMSLF